MSNHENQGQSRYNYYNSKGYKGNDSHPQEDQNFDENQGQSEHVYYDPKGHKKYDFYGDDEYDEYSEDEEEFEEKELPVFNDLSAVKCKDLKNVDIGKIFVLSNLAPYKKLFKHNTKDISIGKKHKLNFSIIPKIKILKLKRPISDITKTKKRNNDISISNYLPRTDKNTIDLKDIESFCQISGPYSDIIKPKKTLKIYLFILKRFFLGLKNEVLSKVKKISFLSINYLNYLYFVLIFLVLSSLYFSFAKHKVESTFKDIRQLKLSVDTKRLKKDLVNTKTDLIISNFLLKPIFFVNYFLNNDDIKNINHILKGTQNLVDYGISLLVIYDGINNLINQKGPGNVMYSELLKNITPMLFELKNSINNSLDEFSKVGNIQDKNLLDFYNSKINSIKIINTYTNIFVDNIDVILNILADQKKRTYLIIFQNNDEIRPTGGFMGSVGLIDVFKGRVIKFEKKDIYALEWEIKNKFDEIAPEGLNKITSKFSLRDANYYPNIRESSEKIKFFLNKTRYKIDGIIYVNQNLILDFLKNFGGVYFDKVKKDLTNDNFSMIISTLVEAKVTKTHTLATPKQILFDFIDIYIKSLRNAGKYSLYIKTILDSIEKRDIILYSFNDSENKLFRDLGLQKNVNTENYLDFNYPVFTSISGNKSDRYIERSFSKEITKNPDCSYKTKLKITLKHNFDISEEINIKNFLYDMDLLGKVDLESTLAIQGKQANKQYVRLLLPKNAIVEKNKNIKVSVTSDNQKQVGFYLDTPLFYQSEFDINYTIPNKECKPYSYLFVKQSGIKKYKLSIVKDKRLVLDNLSLDRDFELK